MNKVAIAALLLACTSFKAQAEMYDEKPFNIGIGTYALTVAYDNLFLDDDFSGFGISAQYAFNDNFAVRGEYYSTDHDDLQGIDNTGVDIVGYFGTGLASHGFKAYIGGGLFSETWDFSGFEEDFDGLQLNGGIGYNWDILALDLVLGIRDASDYEDAVLRFTGFNVDASAVSASLILSGRF